MTRSHRINKLVCLRCQMYLLAGCYVDGGVHSAGRPERIQNTFSKTKSITHVLNLVYTNNNNIH